MLDNAVIDKFVADTLEEMRQIDAQLEAAQATAAALPPVQITSEQQQEAEALLAKARAEAEEAGRLRRSSNYLGSVNEQPQPTSSFSRRRRNFI